MNVNKYIRTFKTTTRILNPCLYIIIKTYKQIVFLFLLFFYVLKIYNL